MRVVWEPASLVRSASLLDQVVSRPLPVVPMGALPWSLSALIHDTVASSERTLAWVRGVAQEERGHLLRIAGTGDGRGGQIRLSLEQLRTQHDRLSGVLKKTELFDAWDLGLQKAMRRDRAIRTGNRHRLSGRYKDPLTARVVRQMLREAGRSKRTRVLGPVVGPSASRFLNSAAKRAPVALKVVGRGVRIAGIALDSADAVKSFQAARNTSDPNARRQKYTDAGVSGAMAVAGVAMFVPFPPVQIVAAGVITAGIAYQNREAIGKVASSVSRDALNVGRSLGGTLKKLF